MSAHATQSPALHPTRALRLAAAVLDAPPEHGSACEAAACEIAAIPTFSITWRIPGPALERIAQQVAVPERVKSAVIECRVSPAAGVVVLVRLLSRDETEISSKDGVSPVEILRLRPDSLRCERDDLGYTHLDCGGIVSISLSDDGRTSYIRSDFSQRLGLSGGVCAAPTVSIPDAQS